MIFVDGTHDYSNVYRDIRNMARIANVTHHLLVADDFVGKFPGVGQAWNELVRERIVGELNCSLRGLPEFRRFGFVVGKYVSPGNAN